MTFQVGQQFAFIDLEFAPSNGSVQIIRNPYVSPFEIVKGLRKASVCLLTCVEVGQRPIGLATGKQAVFQSPELGKDVSWHFSMSPVRAESYNGRIRVAHVKNENEQAPQRYSMVEAAGFIEHLLCACEISDLNEPGIVSIMLLIAHLKNQMQSLTGQELVIRQQAQYLAPNNTRQMYPIFKLFKRDDPQAWNFVPDTPDAEFWTTPQKLTDYCIDIITRLNFVP